MRIDPSTGSFDGYAWGENVGWVRFKNADPPYNVLATANRVYQPLLLRSYPEAPPTPPPTPEPGSVVTNGGFETGNFAGWTTGGYYTRTVETFEPHEAYTALLGEVVPLGYHPAASAWMWQAVEVPSGTGSIKLSFWYRIFTRDRDEDARFRMVLKDSGGVFLKKVVQDGYRAIPPPSQLVDLGWQRKSEDLSAYRG